MSRRHQASLSIDARLLDRLDEIAEEEEKSRSEVANELFYDGLDQRHRAETVTTAAYAGVGTASLVILLTMAANLQLFPLG